MKEELFFIEVPADVRDSFVKVAGRRLAIVGFGMKRASQFTVHPLNWRKHPKKQQTAVEGSLNSLGWVDVVLENRQSGNLIDGHELIWNALKHNDEYVPFIQVDLTDSEESQALLSLDSIAAMAVTDVDNVEALLEQVNTDNEDALEFLSGFAAEIGLDWGRDAGSRDNSGVVTTVCPKCGFEWN